MARLKARISVVIPTIGRPTLENALESCADADEVIVIHNLDGDHGYKARTKGIAKAKGTHLAFLDDDDVYADGAIELIREAACNVPVIFRMRDARTGVLTWREPALVYGNVGTPMFVVPRVLAKLGKWKPHSPGSRCPGGDYSFIAGTCERMGEPIWREEVVAHIRPHVVRRRAAA